jgi:hypothetical protein
MAMAFDSSLRMGQQQKQRVPAQIKFSRHPCALISVPQVYRQWQAEACLRAAQKTATYRSPRFYQLAALVPSAGTFPI